MSVCVGNVVTMQAGQCMIITVLALQCRQMLLHATESCRVIQMASGARAPAQGAQIS